MPPAPPTPTTVIRGSTASSKRALITSLTLSLGIISGGLRDPDPPKGIEGARGADRDEGVHPIPSDRHPTHPIFVNCPFGSNPLAVTPAHAQGGITPSLSPVETDMTVGAIFASCG